MFNLADLGDVGVTGDEAAEERERETTDMLYDVCSILLISVMWV